MNYARVENGSVIKYPYDMYRLKADNPNTSFSRDSFSRADVRATFNIVEVEKVAKPSEDAHHVNEGTPVLVNGTWTQTWEQSPRNTEELNDKVISARRTEYGQPEQQLEFITEHGLDAWQAKVAEIKAKYPKV